MSDKLNAFLLGSFAHGDAREGYPSGFQLFSVESNGIRSLFLVVF